MANRNDRAVIDALGRLTEVMERNQNRHEGNNNFRGLIDFQRNNPPTFKGAYDPEGAQNWIKEHEKIFRAMACTDVQKFNYATFMLDEEAEH